MHTMTRAPWLKPRPARQGQQGIALFEVLIAMIVLSVSFLGTVLLLAKTAKAERSAIYMGRAASLASEMAERIRSSPAAATSYVLNQTYENGSGAVTAPTCGGLFVRPGAAPQNLPACTTAAAAAAFDLASWQVQLQANLPGGVGSIVQGTDSSQRTIVVGWQEPAVDRVNGQLDRVNREDQRDCTANFAAPTTVRCYRMEVRL
ncbi:MAG: type IV pilus modification protein PilV [Ideonella sp. MAG2]|nr:MAG: type IV pilus modification protein PilV [Ideonella sp. MAG2]